MKATATPSEPTGSSAMLAAGFAAWLFLAAVTLQGCGCKREDVDACCAREAADTQRETDTVNVPQLEPCRYCETVITHVRQNTARMWTAVVCARGENKVKDGWQDEMVFSVGTLRHNGIA